MTDFYPLVLAALSKLDRNTEEARQGLYERVRTALAGRLRTVDPPLSEQRIMEERLAFEEAVRRAEADWIRGLAERELLAKLADTIEHHAPADLPQGTSQIWVRLSGKLRQARSGAQFDYTDGTFALAPMGTQADRAAAADPLVRSLRAELEYKARELAARAVRISNPAHWRGLIDAVRMFAKRIGDSDLEVAGDIGTLWALHAALVTQVESQETAGSREIFVPLEADVLRGLRDLVAAAGPWIRMFPTARAFDDQTRTFSTPAIREAAAIFLRGAEAAALVRDADAMILRAVLDRGGSAGIGDKARNWAIQSASNLGIAMLLVMAEIVSGYENIANFTGSSDVAQRIERIVLRHEADLLQIFSHLPDEIRDELRMAIDAIRASAADDV